MKLIYLIKRSSRYANRPTTYVVFKGSLISSHKAGIGLARAENTTALPELPTELCTSC